MSPAWIFLSWTFSSSEGDGLAGLLVPEIEDHQGPDKLPEWEVGDVGAVPLVMERHLDVRSHVRAVRDLSQHVPHVWPMLHLGEDFRHVIHPGLELEMLLANNDPVAEVHDPVLSNHSCLHLLKNMVERWKANRGLARPFTEVIV